MIITTNLANQWTNRYSKIVTTMSTQNEERLCYDELTGFSQGDVEIVLKIFEKYDKGTGMLNLFEVTCIFNGLNSFKSSFIQP